MPQLPLVVQPATDCLFFRDLLPLLGYLLDRSKRPPPQKWRSVYFLLLLFFFLSLLFFFLSLLLVGRDRRRGRCGHGCAVIVAVLFGRDHNRRGCGRVRGRGRGHGGLGW